MSDFIVEPKLYQILSLLEKELLESYSHCCIELNRLKQCFNKIRTIPHYLLTYSVPTKATCLKALLLILDYFNQQHIPMEELMDEFSVFLVPAQNIVNKLYS